MFYGQQLALQFAPEAREGVSNVVGELLNQMKQNHNMRLTD